MLRKWVVRHGNLIAFVSALLIFGTFVTKDYLREELKDDLDSIETARNTFQIKEQIREARSDLGEKLASVESDLNRIPKPKPLDEEMTVFILNRDEMRADLKSAAALLANIEPLSRRLGSVYSTKRGEMAKAVGTSQEHVTDLDADQGVTPTHVMTDANWTVHYRQLNERGGKLREEVNARLNAVNELYDDFLGRAEAAVRDDETKYGRFRTVSLVLYVAGWLIGLLAKMAGVKGEAGE